MYYHRLIQNNQQKDTKENETIKSVRALNYFLKV